MKRTILLLNVSIYVLTLTILQGQYLLALPIFILILKVINKKYLKVCIMLLLVLTISITIKEIKNNKYQTINTVNVVGEISPYKQDNLLSFQGFKVLIKNDDQQDLKPGIYTVRYEKNQFYNKNPNVFSYSKYLKSMAIDDVLYTSNSHFTLLEHKTLSISDKVYRLIENRIDLIFTNKLTSGVGKGLILGDKSGLSEEIKQIFQVNGTSHVLAISGLHIGILYLVFKKLFAFTKQYNTRLALITILFYIWMIGMPYSGVRAFVMILGIELSYILSRKYDVLQTLGSIGVLLILHNPYIVYHTGYQYSFVAILVITILYKSLFKYSQKTSLNLILLPVTIQIGMMPLMVYHNNVIHLLSFIINMLTIPLLTLTLQLSLLLTALPITSFVQFLDFLIQCMVDVNIFFSQLDVFIMTLPSPNIILVITFYVVLALWFEKKHIKILIRLFSLIVILILIYNSVVVEIYFFDVGQGDCALVRHRGHEMLIDAGFSNKHKTLKDILLKNGVTSLDDIFISHSHMDHVGGLQDIGFLIDDATLYYKTPNQNDDVLKSLNVSNKSNIEAFKVLQIGSVTIEPITYQSENDLNNSSSVFILSCYGRKILFTGDIERNVEIKLLDQLQDVDVLKVPHHGANTSSTQAFIEQVLPDHAIISVGKNNYGHPNPEVIQRYEAMGTEIYTTLDGYVKVSVFPFGFYNVKQYK